MDGKLASIVGSTYGRSELRHWQDYGGLGTLLQRFRIEAEISCKRFMSPGIVPKGFWCY